MRIKVLGSRPAPATLVQKFGQMLRGQAPAVKVPRRQIPYWQEKGWTQIGESTYSGNYQTPHGAFQGWIEQERSGRINFYLHNPSAAIRSHSHWTCFQHRNNDWFLIHMGREPKDVSSGIMTIERLIKEAYE